MFSKPISLFSIRLRSAVALGLAILSSQVLGPTGALGEGADLSVLTPQLSEIESLYPDPVGRTDRSASSTPRSPAWLGDKPFDPNALKTEYSIRSLPDLKRYDLSRPPIRHHWVNMLLYPVFGAPRDLIDALFGVASYVPIFNVPITGAMYEVVPTQVFVRPWKDWHRWPGHANSRGHGWIDAESWGFFPHLHSSPFSEVNQSRLKAWETYNQRVDREIEARNKEIERRNAQALDRRSKFVEKMIGSYRAGDFRTAVQGLIPYLEIEPYDVQARAVLVASLTAMTPTLPEREWAESVIAKQIRTASKDMLARMKEEVKTLARQNTERPEPYLWLVWIDARLRNFGEAIEAADLLAEMDLSRVTWRRLRFEAALESGSPEWIDESARAIEETAGEKTEAALHARGRQSLCREDPNQAVSIYEHLSETVPLNARYSYLLAIALIEQSKKTGEYDRSRALGCLRKAAKFAPTNDERDVYLRAREAARLYKPKKR